MSHDKPHELQHFSLASYTFHFNALLPEKDTTPC